MLSKRRLDSWLAKTMHLSPGSSMVTEADISPKIKRLWVRFPQSWALSQTFFGVCVRSLSSKQITIEQLTFNHLSMHLEWYSCKQGSILIWCFSSKSIKQITHLDSPIFLSLEVILYEDRFSTAAFGSPRGFWSTSCSPKFTAFYMVNSFSH